MKKSLPSQSRELWLFPKHKRFQSSIARVQNGLYVKTFQPSLRYHATSIDCAEIHDHTSLLTFSKSLEVAGGNGIVYLGQNDLQNGIFAKDGAEKDNVLLSVPRKSAIVIDYNAGITLSEAAWPRLKHGLALEDPLPWDLLQALALLDGLSGQGGEFWHTYTAELLPSPEVLALPMCWTQERQLELQHNAIIDAAQKQQVRLEGLFPKLSAPIAPDTPSWIQWAFACVRSRAFRAGTDAFAFVPFMDMANHAENPNADFRVSSDGDFELFSRRAIQKGEEVCISYTGVAGYTNQRMMAQYGFVTPGGNSADRLELEDLQGQALRLERIQDTLGDERFMAATTGKEPRLAAAIRSLPLVAEGGSKEVSTSEEMALARRLASQCQRLREGFPTSINEDEELLGQEHVQADTRFAAAVLYRLERKLLIEQVHDVLVRYYS